MTKTIESCGNARYTGKAFPKCNGGNPCKSCLLKYAQVQGGMQTHTVHPTPTPTTVCPCGYDQRIAGAFDMVASAINGNKQVPTRAEYVKALGHTTTFPLMAQTVMEDESGECVVNVLADAVRYGAEMGRHLSELVKLEEMVGYAEGHR